MKVLFRVEAGPRVGLGHLRRSLSLAAALRERGIESHFLVNAGGISPEWMSRQQVPFAILPDGASFGPEDLRWTLQAAREGDARAVIVDYHEVPSSYLGSLLDEGLFVVYRDDLGRGPFSSRIVLNGNADAADLPYPSSEGGTRFLLGPRYAVLAPEFWRRNRRAVRPEVRRILVTLGGGDPSGLMPRILRLLNEMAPGIPVTAIRGPYFQDGVELERATGETGPQVRWIRDPGSVAPWIAEADLAISAAGQTLYELACLGCPTVAIQVVANQLGQLRALERAGFLKVAGEASQPGLDAALRTALAALLRGDLILRSRMGEAGAALVDGQGAGRVAEEILSRAS